MKRILPAAAILALLAATPVLAGPPSLDPFPGKGLGFGGFATGTKPGDGIPGGTIHTKRSPVAVATLLTIFGSVSTVETTAGTD